MPNFPPITTTNSYSILEDFAENFTNIDYQSKNHINGLLEKDANKKENKKGKNEKKTMRKASGEVNGYLQNLPCRFDFSKFFDADLLTIKWLEICNNRFSLLLMPNRPDLKLSIDKWELPGVIFRVETQMDKGQKCTLLEIDYSSEESIKNLRESAKNSDQFFGLIEMSLSVKKAKKQHYACIRFDWCNERNECFPSFFSHRLLQGRDQLNEKMQKPIEIDENLAFVQGVPRFDQDLAEIHFFNGSSSILNVSIPWCDPINKGIHYIYPGWRDSRTNPSKYAFSIEPKQWARLKITFQLPRTKECLREMAEKKEYVWIVIRLEGKGYRKPIDKRLNFTLHRNAANEKWMGKLSHFPPRNLTPKESDEVEKKKQKPYIVNLY